MHHTRLVWGIKECLDAHPIRWLESPGCFKIVQSVSQLPFGLGNEVFNRIFHTDKR